MGARSDYRRPFICRASYFTLKIQENMEVFRFAISFYSIVKLTVIDGNEGDESAQWSVCNPMLR